MLYKKVCYPHKIKLSYLTSIDQDKGSDAVAKNI